MFYILALFVGLAVGSSVGMSFRQRDAQRRGYGRYVKGFFYWNDETPPNWRCSFNDK